MLNYLNNPKLRNVSITKFTNRYTNKQDIELFTKQDELANLIAKKEITSFEQVSHYISTHDNECSKRAEKVLAQLYTEKREALSAPEAESQPKPDRPSPANLN